MGNTHKKQTQFQQYWSQPAQATILQHIPGTPKIIYSLYGNNSTKEQEQIGIAYGQGSGIVRTMPITTTSTSTQKSKNIQAEYYTLQIINTNQDQQISIYKQRKIGYKNIVGIYDFYTNKNILGCTRSALCYNIITERIQYRLEQFKNLSGLELLYIFHEAVCGYQCIGKYQKICYPNSMKIGIKDNGQVRVWINQNWASNYYIKCRNQRTSVEALWNCIKLCGDSTETIIGNCNNKIYGLGNQRRQYGFDDVVEMMRNQFGKEIIQGKFVFQKRVKDIKQNLYNKLYSSSPAEFVGNRPRAFSEEVVRKGDGERGERGGGFGNVSGRGVDYSSGYGYGSSGQKIKPKSSYSFRQVSQFDIHNKNKNKQQQQLLQQSSIYTQPTQNTQQTQQTQHTQRSLTCTKPPSVTYQQQTPQLTPQQQQNMLILTKSKQKNIQQFTASSQIRNQYDGSRNNIQGEHYGIIGGGSGGSVGSKNNSPGLGQSKKQSNPPSPQIIKNNMGNIQIMNAVGAYQQIYTSTAYNNTNNNNNTNKYPSNQPQAQTKPQKPQQKPSPPSSPPQPSKNIQPNYYNILIQNKINSDLAKKTGQNIQLPSQQQNININKTNINTNSNSNSDNKKINFSYKNSQFGVIGNLNQIIDQKYNTSTSTNTNITGTPNPNTTTKTTITNNPNSNTSLNKNPPPQNNNNKQQQLYIYTNPKIVIKPLQDMQPYTEQQYKPVTQTQRRQQLQQSPINNYPNTSNIQQYPRNNLYTNANNNTNTNISKFILNQVKNQPQTIPDVYINLDNIGKRYENYSKTQRTTVNSPYITINTSREHETDRQRDCYRVENSLDNNYQQQYQQQQQQLHNYGSNSNCNSNSNNSGIRQMQVLEIGQSSYYSPEKTIKISRDPPPINIDQGARKEQQLDSRKVAQEFKYYLRSIQRSPEKIQQDHEQNQDQADGNRGEIQAELEDQEQNQDQYEGLNNSRRNKYVYESNAPVIPERWDEQESLSQNF